MGSLSDAIALDGAGTARLQRRDTRPYSGRAGRRKGAGRRRRARGHVVTGA